MTSWCQIERIGSKRCHNCNRESASPDNFCRWCGFHQSEGSLVAPKSAQWQTSRTTVLEHEEEIPRSVSRQPLDALTQSAGEKTGSLRLNRYGALVIAVLVAIPMWLLIILLSPFDAYLAARAKSIVEEIAKESAVHTSSIKG